MHTRHKNLKRAATAAGLTVAAIGATASSAFAGTPLPPEGTDKYDCLLSVPLLDQANPLVVGAVACSGTPETEADAGTDADAGAGGSVDTGNGADADAGAGGSVDTGNGADADAGAGGEADAGTDVDPGSDEPGNGENAPGQTQPDGPGNSENAPGRDARAAAHTDETPQLARTGSKDHAGKAALTAGALIALGGGLLVMRRRMTD